MKDTIGEAAESMREPWERYLSETQGVSPYPLQAHEVNHMAIYFVSKLMPDETPGTVVAVAKRLRTG
jgi:hypothetical protein